MERYWTIRSQWDYFAFIAVFVWTFVGLSSVAYGLARIFSTFGADFLVAVAIMVFALSVGMVILGGSLSVLVPLATIYGSVHHDHLEPGPFYHLAALVFGPFVGLHYLNRTTDDIRFQKQTDLMKEFERSTSRTDKN